MHTKKQFLTLTKALLNHNISYQWGYPTRLLITKQINTILSLEKGLKLLKGWKILAPDAPIPDKPPPPKLAMD